MQGPNQWERLLLGSVMEFFPTRQFFCLLSFQDSETFSERHAVQFVRKEGEIKHQNYSHTGKQM